MRYFATGMVLVAMWGLVGAIAFKYEKATPALIVSLAVIVLFGTVVVAEIGFKESRR